MEKQKRTKSQISEMIQGYGFITPALLIILVFFVLAILFAVYLSFNDVNLIMHTYEWNGFRNYQNLFQDKQLLRALQNTGFFALVVVPVQILINFQFYCWLLYLLFPLLLLNHLQLHLV